MRISRTMARICLFLGVLGSVVFGFLANATLLTNVFVATHTPPGGLEDFDCPIILGQNESAHVHISVKNPQQYTLSYRISLESSQRGLNERIIGRTTLYIPGQMAQSADFPITGDKTEKLDIRVEAISDEDPKMAESGGGTFYPFWRSSFSGSCTIFSIGLPLPFNLIFNIAFRISLFGLIVGIALIAGRFLANCRENPKSAGMFQKEVREHSVGIIFFVRWLLAGCIGTVLGNLIFSDLLRLAPGYYLVLFVICGAVQWYILRRTGEWGDGQLDWLIFMIIYMGIALSYPLAIFIKIDMIGERLNHLIQGILFMSAIGANFGLAIGLAQWIVLRPELRLPGWWPLATLCGWSLGTGGGWLLTEGLGLIEGQTALEPLFMMAGDKLIQALQFAITGGMIGLALGFTQQLVLRKNALFKGLRWMLVNGLAAAIGWVVADAAGWWPPFSFGWPGSIVVGMIVGVSSGIVLIRWLNLPADRDILKSA